MFAFQGKMIGIFVFPGTEGFPSHFADSKIHPFCKVPRIILSGLDNV